MDVYKELVAQTKNGDERNAVDRFFSMMSVIKQNQILRDKLFTAKY